MLNASWAFSQVRLKPGRDAASVHFLGSTQDVVADFNNGTRESPTHTVACVSCSIFARSLRTYDRDRGGITQAGLDDINEQVADLLPGVAKMRAKAEEQDPDRKVQAAMIIRDTQASAVGEVSSGAGRLG